MAEERSHTSDDARRIADAVLFAAHAHAGQIRTDKGDPYFNHLAEVAALCAALEPFDSVLVTACYLHDTIEDTEVTEADLRARFGNEVTDLVMDVTDPPGLKGDARRARQVTHTAACGKRVKLLKLADKTSNVEELIGLSPSRFDATANALYLDWSRKVVDVCRGLEPVLEARFDASTARLETVIATHLRAKGSAA